MIPTWLAIVFFLLALAVIASAAIVEWRRHRRQQRFFRDYEARYNHNVRRAILTRCLRDDRLRKAREEDGR